MMHSHTHMNGNMDELDVMEPEEMICPRRTVEERERGNMMRPH